MDNNKIQMTFVQKIENYWYHYKWHTIIGVFAFVIALICITQCAKKVEYDAMIMYAGNFKIAEEYREKTLENIMSEDYNGDGEKLVSVFQLVLNIAGKDGEYEYFDPVAQNEEIQRLEIELSAGDSVIYILHPYIYEQYKTMMRPLDQVLDQVPEYAIDEYGLPISEMFSYMNTTLNFYPENSIVCIRNMRTENTLVSRKDDPEYYENNVKFFRDLVEY